MGAYQCHFENNTKYMVEIVDYDGTRKLRPGERQKNYLLRGGYYSVDLVMSFDDKKEVKINFPGYEFENRTHKMSIVFAKAIEEYEMSLLDVIGGYSEWHLVYNHPGGYEEEREVSVVSKHSWKNMEERGGEIEVKAKMMILAVEQSLSTKAFMKVTRVDEFESQITEKMRRKFKDPCYLWQEIVVIKTSQPPPFKMLKIPTCHLEHSSTAAEPGRNKFIYDGKKKG